MIHHKELLDWYGQMGVDEVIEDEPVNHRKQIISEKPAKVLFKKTTEQKGMPMPLKSPIDIQADTRKIANSCSTIEQLKEAVIAFDGVAITRTATNTVFSDGNPDADIMMVGEAPGAEEDMRGVPFCGASGKLLDQMLAYIGLERQKNFYITNTVFWRPPGNRKPTPEELLVCEPFVQKHIALMKPKLLILIGGTAVVAVLGEKRGITKLRGQFFNYTNEYLQVDIPTAVFFHPSYLLRSPGQKRYAWQDLLGIEQFLQTNNITTGNVAS